ncbi:hypothetical protein [Bradyrhizobium sp. LM2.3]
MIPIKVDLGVAPEINYSLLHNNRTLLDKLTLTRLIQHPVDAITIQVELCVGAENYPYPPYDPGHDGVAAAAILQSDRPPHRQPDALAA